MARITIDGREFEVQTGQNLLQAALSESIDLPYFCWHPALGSVGACRQCAVMQYTGESDETGRLAMACMTPVADGMRFSVEAVQARDFRRTVVEWLMMSHPHDCPVCEEGGECHLQDMTVMTGHVQRVYPGTKRTWRNQYLGPFLGHEMNRCITCYRCVRFYRDYAGGRDLEDFGSRDRVFFGRASDGVLESEFAGNLVEVCPTGVFTDKPFSQRYTRKWDLRSAPSVCPGCAVGCATLVSERYGAVRRVHNRYHPDVNGYFLCDRGRFGQAWNEHEGRVRRIGRRADDGGFDETSADEAIETIGGALADGIAGRRVLGIGSPRASVETNFALARLVGADAFCAGLAADEQPSLRLAVDGLRAGAGRIPTLAEVEEADAILILGEDPIDVAPRLALALRQAVHAKALAAARDAGIPDWQDAGVRSHGRYSRHPLCLATVVPSRSADLADVARCGSPADLADFGRAIAAAIADGADAGAVDDAQVAQVAQVAAALLGAERPLVISGSGCADARVPAAALDVVDALAAAGRSPSVLMLAREANAFGAVLLADALGAGPTGAGIDAGLDVDGALARMEAGEVDVLLLAENDLYRRDDRERVARALAAVSTVVVLDAVEHGCSATADWLLPTASHVESEGTLVSFEGRAQRFFPAIDPPAPIAPAWRWLEALAVAAGRRDEAAAHVDALIADCAALAPELAGLVDAAPGADWRGPTGQRVARETHRYSGRTAMRAHLDVHEPRTPLDDESPLAWSMEGVNRPDGPAGLTPWYWSPGWNSNQSVTRFQEEVAGPLRGGEAGRRLLEPRGGRALAAGEAPARAPGLALVPLQHVFGSDERASLTPAIVERTEWPLLLLAPVDAEAVGLAAGDGAVLLIDDAERGRFRVGVEPALAPGWAAFSAGLPGTPASTPRGRVSLAPAPDFPPPAADAVIARG